ncbi:MAG: glycerol-3-phosphate dehydrogenase/oxidase [Deltaproteobacteria bacterium]|nr:MAG: glycerol-3-phosphate dehydrogenase/oxidase [Deltaproteobacteria bacterium]
MVFGIPKSYGGSFSHRTRKTNLKRLRREEFDLAVIGGGITGAAIVRDAALRGMKVALFEKGDFASGTSSKSSKMIHGGLRYLKQLDIGLVKESLAEREKLLQLAPHLVHPVPYLIPIYSGWMERIEMHIGLIGYDFLAGDSSLGRHRNLSPEEVLAREPSLRSEKLYGGFLYHDCLVDDARLTLATVKSAHEHGSVIVNHTRATGLTPDTGDVHQLRFQDVLSSKQGKMKARVVVVAAGPWTDEVLRLCRHPGPALRPTKGVHLVFRRNRLNVQQVVVVPTEDKRMIFVVPFGEFTFVGTTDTDYAGSLDRVLVEAADVSYLLDGVNHCFPTLSLGPRDVVSCWAGLRPLVQGEGAPSQVSRDYDISLYEDGLVVITGGKLTTHRTMAMSLVDQVLERYAHRLEGEFKPCRTGESALVGGEMAEFSSYLKAQSLGLVRKWGLSETTVDHLILSYGRHHMDILALGLRDRKLLEPIAPGCRVIKAEVIHAVEEEMALTLEDFMSRRTSLLHFGCEHGAPVTVAKLMGKWLGWNRSRRRAEIRRYRETVKEMFHFRSASYGE